MKLSTGTIGTLIYTAIATAAFVWMAKRPAVEATAMNFGMPSQSISAASSITESEAKEEKVDEPEEKMEATEINTTTEETTTEPEKPVETDAPATTPTN